MNVNVDGGGVEAGELHVHVAAGGGGIYKSTAGVMEQHPDVYALTIVIVFQDVAFAPAVPSPLWHRWGALSKQGSRTASGERELSKPAMTLRRRQPLRNLFVSSFCGSFKW